MRFVSIIAAVARFFAVAEVRENFAAVSRIVVASHLHLRSWWMQLGMSCYSSLSNPCAVTLDDGGTRTMSWTRGIKPGSQLGYPKFDSRRGLLRMQMVPVRCESEPVLERGRA
ncbi:hypothetical protein CA13_43660 [Planctomycetes bacterium CA13]|uniref:Uncharacterized protein n=1 Tax=Novipirellula herctigrandis TaxID=2527986 RepID=A0A5C5Z8P7_9BACT|nr:hypothetical protein CA13_43660 [Planctomycetes bacterium CA13]